MPEVCFGCNVHLNRGEELLCTFCRNEMPLTDYDYNEENPVDRIFYGRVKVKKAASFVFFHENGLVQRLIHQLKYRGQEQISGFFGDWYGQQIKEGRILKGKIDLVVPVPLHPKKLRKRGYNQTAGFASRLAFHLNAEYADNILIKTADTRTQTKKGRLGRWQDDRSLYELSDPSYVKNKNILLVDDVITTGATMETCISTVQEASGTTIYLASIAVVPKLWN